MTVIRLGRKIREAIRAVIRRVIESLLRGRPVDQLKDIPRSPVLGSIGYAELYFSDELPVFARHLDHGFLRIDQEPREPQPSPVDVPILHQTTRSLDISSSRPVTGTYTFTPAIGQEVDNGEPGSWQEPDEGQLWGKITNHWGLTGQFSPGNSTGTMRVMAQTILGVLAAGYQTAVAKFPTVNTVFPQTTAEGIFRDPNDGSYWRVRIEGTSAVVRFVKYITPAELITAAIAAHAAADSSGEGKGAVSADCYALLMSNLPEEPLPEQVVAFPTDISPWGDPFAYSWHFNYRGDEAAIVLHELTGSKLSFAAEGGQCQYKSRTVRLVFSRDTETGVFSIEQFVDEEVDWTFENGKDWFWRPSGAQHCAHRAEFYCDQDIPGDCDAPITRDTLDPLIGLASNTPVYARYISDSLTDARNNTLLVTKYTHKNENREFGCTPDFCGMNATVVHRNCGGSWIDFAFECWGGPTRSQTFNDILSVGAEFRETFRPQRYTYGTYHNESRRVTVYGGWPDGNCNQADLTTLSSREMGCPGGEGANCEQTGLNPDLPEDYYAYEVVDIWYTVGWTTDAFTGRTDVYGTGEALIFPTNNAEAVMIAKRETHQVSTGSSEVVNWTSLEHGSRLGRVWRVVFGPGPEPPTCDDPEYDQIYDGRTNKASENPNQVSGNREVVRNDPLGGKYYDRMSIHLCGRYSGQADVFFRTFYGTEPAFDIIGNWTLYQYDSGTGAPILCVSHPLTFTQGMGPEARWQVGLNDDPTRAIGLLDGFPSQLQDSKAALTLGGA